MEPACVADSCLGDTRCRFVYSRISGIADANRVRVLLVLIANLRKSEFQTCSQSKLGFANHLLKQSNNFAGLHRISLEFHWRVHYEALTVGVQRACRTEISWKTRTFSGLESVGKNLYTKLQCTVLFFITSSNQPNWPTNSLAFSNWTYTHI